jgi:large subunit ribosomal protein L32
VKSERLPKVFFLPLAICITFAILLGLPRDYIALSTVKKIVANWASIPVTRPEEVEMAKHPVPKKKTSKSKRDMRRSHHALVAPNLTTCKNCGSKKPQHVVCAECGFYDGRQVLAVASA